MLASVALNQIPVRQPTPDRQVIKFHDNSINDLATFDLQLDLHCVFGVPRAYERHS